MPQLKENITINIDCLVNVRVTVHTHIGCLYFKLSTSYVL